mmetsp:Transcript_1155/g.2145  ORF Transcript_1155/g.2145 Transcript_1155/m.2145 type:complete len:100 (+) Transcript_1155:661-960(+)
MLCTVRQSAVSSAGPFEGRWAWTAAPTDTPQNHCHIALIILRDKCLGTNLLFFLLGAMRSFNCCPNCEVLTIAANQMFMFDCPAAGLNKPRLNLLPLQR